MLGKETIDTNTFGRSTGHSGNYSTNWQLTGRELLTPDEVRMLDNAYALLFVRGERPIQDFKFDIAKHPKVSLTTDGGLRPYNHGEDTMSVATISLESLVTLDGIPELEVADTTYTILSEEEVEELF